LEYQPPMYLDYMRGVELSQRSENQCISANK
jgi:hypothetical protein